MIYKFIIIHDNKFIFNKFSINKIENYIEIKNLELNLNNLIKIPIYNNYNGTIKIFRTIKQNFRQSKRTILRNIQNY